MLHLLLSFLLLSSPLTCSSSLTSVFDMPSSLFLSARSLVLPPPLFALIPPPPTLGIFFFLCIFSAYPLSPHYICAWLSLSSSFTFLPASILRCLLSSVLSSLPSLLPFPSVSCCHCGKESDQSEPTSQCRLLPSSLIPSVPSLHSPPPLPPPLPHLLASHLPLSPTTFISSLPGDEI